MTEKKYFYQNGTFSVEDSLFYENNTRIGYFEDEEKEEIPENNHKTVVDRLIDLRDSNIYLKRNNRKIRKENKQLKEENHELMKGLYRLKSYCVNKIPLANLTEEYIELIIRGEEK